MKPKDLQPPFTWENRRVMIQDKVWHVPARCPDYDSFVFPGWNDPTLFSTSKPVIVEYCCGNGTWLAEKAQQQPQFNWVGVEMRYERVRKVWSKIHNLCLDNLIVIGGEAYLTTRLYFPSHSIHAAYVNFPDPWPKKRHAKHRLFQAPFIQELWRTLAIGASVIVATDDDDYSEQLISEFSAFPFFKSAFPDPFYVTEWPDYGTSFFETLWRAKGKTIRYHRFNTLPQDIS